MFTWVSTHCTSKRLMKREKRIFRVLFVATRFCTAASLSLAFITIVQVLASPRWTGQESFLRLKFVRRNYAGSGRTNKSRKVWLGVGAVWSGQNSLLAMLACSAFRRTPLQMIRRGRDASQLQRTSESCPHPQCSVYISFHSAQLLWLQKIYSQHVIVQL